MPSLKTPNHLDALLLHRWGSEEAFEIERGARMAQAEAAYEARKRAFNDQVPAAAMQSASSSPSGESGGQDHVSEQTRRRFPSRPRILGVANEKNNVGVLQQRRQVITGEKYGFYTVVNDAYFDRGPTVSAQ